jgi:hypothetical protein
VGSSVNLLCDNSIITKDGNVKATLVASAIDAGSVPVFDVPLSFAVKKSSTGKGSIILEIKGKSYTENQLSNLLVKTDTLGEIEITVSGSKGIQDGLVYVDLEVGALGYTAVQQFELKETGYTVNFTQPTEERITYISPKSMHHRLIITLKL